MQNHSEVPSILTDTFGRRHTYLRISLTERCNLRCTYCMPEEGIALRPRAEFMRTEEVLELARIFVEAGVTKIRLTGGEPLIRKDAEDVIRGLGKLPVELAITTNGVIVDRFVHVMQEAGLRAVNVSLDSLRPERTAAISRRDHHQTVTDNIRLLQRSGFRIKINTVLMRGTNDDEITDFIRWTTEEEVQIRFIEFMPFDGNKWDKSLCVSEMDILNAAEVHFGAQAVERLMDAANDTAHNYRIKGSPGTFAVISTVTNPFCDTCNRLRLTADGKIKNCLFDTSETDLLATMRKGGDVRPLIQQAVKAKSAARGGMQLHQDFYDAARHAQNRPMTAIGG